MIERGIAKRYARALLAVAKEQGQDKIDIYGDQIKAINEGFSADGRRILNALSDRYVDIFAREKAVAKVAEQAGADQNIGNFLKLLIRKGRISLFNEITEAYDSLAHEELGRELMTVVSAKELEGALYDKLTTIFAKVYGKTMVLKKEIKPELVGGLRVHVRDQVFDNTVTTQIDRIKLAMNHSAR